MVWFSALWDIGETPPACKWNMVTTHADTWLKNVLEEFRWCGADKTAYSVMCSVSQLYCLSWFGALFSVAKWNWFVPSNQQLFSSKLVFLKQELRVERLPAS